METNIQRKIRAKANMKEHLFQMSYLSGNNVVEEDLLDLETTDAIFKEYQQKSSPSNYYLIPQNVNLIGMIIDKLILSNAKCYLICEFSFDAGLLIISINQFNCHFNFNHLNFYRVTIADVNLSDEIIFWEAENNQIEIEIKGKWKDIVKQILLN